MNFNDKSLPMENCSDYEKKYRILWSVPYFKEVHDGELIADSWSCVLNSEVIPLCVFVGVQIISKPQLVFSIITMMKK